MTAERTWFLRNKVTHDDIVWLANFDLVVETRVIDPVYHFQVTTIATVNERQDTLLKIRFGSDIECVDEIVHK